MLWLARGSVTRPVTARARISCPHTYNDIDTFDDFSLPNHRGEQNQFGGRTWYRKIFTAPKEWDGKKIYIEFEAVRQRIPTDDEALTAGECSNAERDEARSSFTKRKLAWPVRRLRRASFSVTS